MIYKAFCWSISAKLPDVVSSSCITVVLASSVYVVASVDPVPAASADDTFEAVSGIAAASDEVTTVDCVETAVEDEGIAETITDDVADTSEEATVEL